MSIFVERLGEGREPRTCIYIYIVCVNVCIYIFIDNIMHIDLIFVHK